MPSALIRSSSAPLTTETASGTSCTFSVRFCAVTTISSIAGSAALTSGPAASIPDMPARLANRVLKALPIRRGSMD